MKTDSKKTKNQKGEFGYLKAEKSGSAVDHHCLDHAWQSRFLSLSPCGSIIGTRHTVSGLSLLMVGSLPGV